MFRPANVCSYGIFLHIRTYHKWMGMHTLYLKCDAEWEYLEIQLLSLHATASMVASRGWNNKSKLTLTLNKQCSYNSNEVHSVMQRLNGMNASFCTIVQSLSLVPVVKLRHQNVRDCCPFLGLTGHVCFWLPSAHNLNHRWCVIFFLLQMATLMLSDCLQSPTAAQRPHGVSSYAPHNWLVMALTCDLLTRWPC